MDYSSLRPASFRGVPFAVRLTGGQFGRRSAVHEYPMRDEPWAEDLGRKAREFRVQGFLLSDSRIYGGGSVETQIRRLIAAVEAAGPGALVLPTRGEIEVAGSTLMLDEAEDAATTAAFVLTCTEAGQRVLPAEAADTAAKVEDGAASAASAASASFTDRVLPAIRRGAAVVGEALRTARSWGAYAGALGGDATSLLNMAARLPGPYGRYFNAANQGLGGLARPARAVGATLGGLIGEGTGLRATIGGRVNGLIAAATLGDAAGMAVQAFAVTGALRAAAQNPADGLRLLGRLAAPAGRGFDVQAPSASVVGRAIGLMQEAGHDLYRRAAVIDMARVGATYQPASYDDAQAVRARLLLSLDQEIDTAGDRGEDTVYRALRSLRLLADQDLTARGADLAPLRTFALAAPRPALALASQLYADPLRADQLVGSADPVHPLFMAPRFRALAH